MGNFTPAFYSYEAALHCPYHAGERFGEALYSPETTDYEGNPVHAVFSWEVRETDYCDECAAEARYDCTGRRDCLCVECQRQRGELGD